MCECKVYSQGISEGSDSFRATRVFRYDDTGFPVDDVFADPASKGRFSVEVIDGDGEESLHLGGVKVHGYDVGYACHCK